MARPATNHDGIYRLRIGLRYMRTPVWRVLLVPGHFPLDLLHDAIQSAMGWEQCHLHDFQIGKRRFSLPEVEGVEDEGAIRLAEVARLKSKITYTYDFGDDWIHDIVVEAIEPAEPGSKYPRCVDGSGRCPPEDCGGPGGYQRILEILSDPAHPEHDEILDMHGTIDPKQFSLDGADRHSRQPERKKKPAKRKS